MVPEDPLKEFRGLLGACAAEVARFPHPSHCEHLHDATKLLNSSARIIEVLTAALENAARSDLGDGEDWSDDLSREERYPIMDARKALAEARRIAG